MTLRGLLAASLAGIAATASWLSLAEPVIGRHKTEMIHRRSPWRSLQAVDLATREWVAWFNHRRLLEPVGLVPPAKAETAFYGALKSQPIAA
jgi:putative transposase